MCPVQKDGKWGIINTKGTMLLPLTYAAMENFDQGLLSVKDGSRFEYIDRKFNVIWRGPETCAAA